jgi:protocatechuate 3,4-dioxygenase beta subunit
MIDVLCRGGERAARLSLLALGVLGLAAGPALAEAPEDAITLSGKAVSLTGAPVPGVKVTFENHSPMPGEKPGPWHATTGADGTFRVSVPAGVARQVGVSVEATPGGRLAPCAVVGGPAISIFSQQPDPMTILCAPATSRVTGTVTGPDGKPVPGASVTLILSSQAGWHHLVQRKAVADKQGKYLIAGLAAGDYVMGPIDPPVGTSLVRLYSWKPGLVRRVDLREGATSVENFSLPAGARLVGRALDESGKPVAGAAVSCSLDAATEEGPKNMYQMPGQWYGGNAVTDAEGRYSVGGLTKETYHLEIRPPEGKGLAPAVLRGVNAPDSGDVELQDVTLYREGRLAGVVLGPDGKPVAGARVAVPGAATRTDPPPAATTDTAGRFVLAGLPTDKYSATVTPPAGSPSCEHVFEGLAVVSGLTIRHELKLPEGAAVAGTVTDPDGRPVAGAAVRIMLGYQRGPEATTDASGNFKIVGVTPALRQTGPGQPPEIKLSVYPPATSASLLVASQTLKGLAAGQTADLNIKLAGGGILTGIVKGPDGRPLAKCTVIAFQQMGNYGYTSTGGDLTGPDGRYTIGHVPPGNWALSVLPPSGSTLMMQAVPAKNVAPGSTETADVTLQTGAVVAGRLTTTRGTPVAGAHVRLDLGRDGGVPYMPGMENQGRYVALTDKDGVFRFKGLTPGTHKIHCSPIDPGLLIQPADVKVTGAGETKAELVASITGSLRGTVHDAAGGPLGYESVSLRLQQADGGKAQYSPYPGKDGQFLCSRMLPGKYTLTVAIAKAGLEKNLAAPQPLEVVVRETQETKVDVEVGSK